MKNEILEGSGGEVSSEVKARCINALLESTGVKVEADMAEAAIKMAGLIPREVRDLVDYGNELEIVGDERYISVDAYLSTLRDRLVYAIHHHDLEALKN